MAVTFSERPSRHYEVGLSKKRGKFLGYSTAPKEKDGWTKSKKCLPLRCDLVWLRLESNKIINGWWNGACWFGSRLKTTDKVVAWKQLSFERD
jgi:hypothetical protein